MRSNLSHQNIWCRDQWVTRNSMAPIFIFCLELCLPCPPYCYATGRDIRDTVFSIWHSVKCQISVPNVNSAWYFNQEPYLALGWSSQSTWWIGGTRSSQWSQSTSYIHVQNICITCRPTEKKDSLTVKETDKERKDKWQTEARRLSSVVLAIVFTV